MCFTPRRVYGAVCASLLSLCLPLFFATQPAFSADGDLTALWQVGQADQKGAEFALGPDHYNQYSAEGFYVVGRSSAQSDWPYIQPGPADSWAGGRPHPFEIVFGLQKAPTAASRLDIRLLDTQDTIPPRVQVKINEFSQELQLPRGGGDASLTGQLTQNKPFVWSIPVPASALKAGTNRVTITSVAGSWMLYDAVTFVAPPQTESAPVNPVLVESVDAPTVLDRDKTSGTFVQPVTVRMRNFGPATQAKLTLSGESRNVAVPPGNNEITFTVPETQKETQSRLSVEVDGKPVADTSVTIRPVRHWNIYLMPDSHVDIGYTHLQEEVRKKQIANLQEALALIKRTANYPADSQFKWNLEVLWPIEDYLRTATPEQRKEVFDAIRSGKLIVNAYFGNLLTGLCSSEELLRASIPSLKVARQAGVALDTALQSDTPGYTWGNVTAMSQAGVKYFSPGPNPNDRIGASLITWHDRPFYWTSPSGQSKVLFWMPYGGYALGIDLHKQLIPFIPRYLQELEEAKYPYDITSLRWCVNGDNGSPDEDLSDTVRDWNEKHAFPHLIISASRDAFVALEKRYGSKIPTYTGDFTPYWEDGAGSTARETAMKRNATDRLLQAQALWAMQNRPGFPAADFYKAWEDAMLYSEHTWGASNSVSQPDAENVKSQWAYKRAFAVRADEASRRLLSSAVSPATATSAVDVFNTESWKRTELALIPTAQSKAGDRVVDGAGKAVPSQRLSDGSLAILVRDIAPFSSRRYSILPGKAAPVGNASAKGNTISNSMLTAQVDATTGAITDLRMKGIAGNLVDAQAKTAVNDYFYLLGGDTKDAVRNATPKITIEDSGPLVATLRIDSQAPGLRSLTRHVRLVSDVAQIELSNTVDKLPIRDKEGVHFGFGFNVPDAVTRMEMPLSVVRPEQDQLPSSNKNWYPVQHWVDVSNSKYGVTLATRDAPLVEVGGLTAHLPGHVDQTDPRWIQHTKSSAILYSWVMNNHWHTNYKADQEGLVRFRYAIAPHGAFTPDQAARFGQGFSRPLVMMPASGQPRQGSLLQVSSPGVTVSELKPSNDGKAWIVRLWGASGREQRVRLTWQGRPLLNAQLSDIMEGEGAKVGPDITVPGYGLTTIRIARG